MKFIVLARQEESGKVFVAPYLYLGHKVFKIGKDTEIPLTMTALASNLWQKLHMPPSAKKRMEKE